jgi:3-hydroxybutyryl-CoA dehydratase
MRFDELSVGQTAVISETITDAHIARFAELSGDRNPLHLDDAWARKTRFGGRIAHGAFTGALVSRVLGMELPGTGSVYLSQSLRFTAPVRPGDTVTARAEVIDLDPKRRRVKLRTTCSNQRGETIADGEAVMLVDEVPA